jgi:hypothetical protein
MKVGDLVLDTTVNELAIIVEVNPNYVDEEGQLHEWDYELFVARGDTVFADKDEVEVVNERRVFSRNAAS